MAEHDTPLDWGAIGQHHVHDLLSDVAGTNPDDEPARLALIQQHCELCQATSGQSELARLTACAQQRCGLRSPEEYIYERRFVAWSVVALRDANTASDDDVNTFNEHIAAYGCATLGIGRRINGFRRIGYVGSTLRGALHRALVLLTMLHAGERIHMNLNAGTAGEQVDILRQEHQRFREQQRLRRQREQEEQILAMHDRGMSVKAITLAMGWGDDRGRTNRVLQRAGRKEKGQRYKQI